MQPLIIPYKPLSRCGIEELSAARELRAKRLHGGVAFARKDEHEEKDAARAVILDLLTLEAEPAPLRVLSMPGAEWCFEAKLLKRRDPEWRLKAQVEATHFTCVENDRFVFYSAATRIPGIAHCGVITHDRPEYAERAIGNGVIARYVFANVDDLMQCEGERFDVAWLDYTGPLSVKRLQIIARFWQRSVSRLLVVTSLKARWNKETGRAMERRGGIFPWMRAHLPGEVLHELEYQDGGSPMVQFAVRKGGSE